MRILITNESLAEAGGTQAWVRDFALALRARGHEALAYTWRAGAFASALRADGVPVATRLKDTGRAPDIVHGHHAQAVAALARHTASAGVIPASAAAVPTAAPCKKSRRAMGWSMPRALSLLLLTGHPRY